MSQGFDLDQRQLPRARVIVHRFVKSREFVMHEVFLPIMVMVFTLLVMGGLVVVFRGWMIERDRLLEQERATDD